ncbi:hypothetical protein GGS21DRAFT_514996 [Xylaria nigripes]|nr:hypothetical protein GGS21DRAFT_514996 [Xylaria nigripes]
MPSLTQPDRSMMSPYPRKRRREDGGEVQMPFLTCSPTLETTQNLLSVINNNDRIIIPSNRGAPSLFNLPGKAISLPLSKKLRVFDENDHGQADRNGMPPAALAQSQQSHFPHAHPDIVSSEVASSHEVRPSISKTNSSSTVLSPCHICHRKPTKKSDLDSFADCMGCDERTCFVCLRACQGWPPVSEGGRSDHAVPEDDDFSVSLTMQDVDDEGNTHYHDSIVHPRKTQQRQKKGEGGEVGSWTGHGHRAVICSRCCIERGSEGEVVCLGCLAGMEGA